MPCSFVNYLVAAIEAVMGDEVPSSTRRSYNQLLWLPRGDYSSSVQQESRSHVGLGEVMAIDSLIK